MSNKNVTLADGTDQLYPKTFDYNVYNSSNVSLDNVVSGIKDTSGLTSSNIASWQTTLNDLETPNLSDSVAHGQTGQAVVIETYLSSNKKTWYRKWSDGWKECGTVYTASSGYGTWTLPITFSSTNYVAVATVRTSESSSNSYIAQANPLSSSTVRITKRYENGSSRGYAGEDGSVYCCGY